MRILYYIFLNTLFRSYATIILLGYNGRYMVNNFDCKLTEIYKRGDITLVNSVIYIYIYGI